jgi:hypothetical protein
MSRRSGARETWRATSFAAYAVRLNAQRSTSIFVGGAAVAIAVRIGVRIDAMTARRPNCVQYRLAIFVYAPNRGQRLTAGDETATTSRRAIAF